MKIRSLLATLLVATLLWSCSDETDLTITLKESGTLKIELTQDANPVAGAMVYLIPEMNVPDKAISNTYIDYAIDFKETNANGLVDFGEVNAGNYTIITEGVTVSDLVYNPIRIVQVISGSEKKFSIETLDYTGSIKLTVLKYDNITYEYIPNSGLKVAILPEEDLYSTNTIEEAIDIAYVEKTTGSDGILIFDLPSGYYYYAIFYTTDSYGEIMNYDSYSITYLETGEECNRTFQLYF